MIAVSTCPVDSFGRKLIVNNPKVALRMYRTISSGCCVTWDPSVEILQQQSVWYLCSSKLWICLACQFASSLSSLPFGLAHVDTQLKLFASRNCSL